MFSLWGLISEVFLQFLNIYICHNFFLKHIKNSECFRPKLLAFCVCFLCMAYILYLLSWLFCVSSLDYTPLLLFYLLTCLHSPFQPFPPLHTHTLRQWRWHKILPLNHMNLCIQHIKCAVSNSQHYWYWCFTAFAFC